MRDAIYRLLDRHIWICHDYAKRPLKGFYYPGAPSSITFLDLDGTLMPDIGPGGLLRGNRIYPVWESIRSNVKNTSWVIITNQSCFARQERFRIRDILRYIRFWNLLVRKLRIDAVLVCHHHPEALSRKLRQECSFRKPAGFLIANYAEMKNIDLATSSLIGDRITDAIAATSAGISNTALIYNSKLFEENQSGSIPIWDHAFFSLLSSPEESSFCREINEII